MNIEIKDEIKLDDNNEYVVVSKIIYENNIYFYIVNINNNTEFKILRYNKENEKLSEFEDQELVKNLLPLLLEEAAKHINIEI